MIYFYWLTGLGFSLALSVLICLAGEYSDKAAEDKKD